MKSKVSIIGAGNVGATAAQAILESGLADVVLFDIAEGIPQGKALDLTEAASLRNVSTSCTGTNDYAGTADSDVVVITAGFPRKPGMSRDDLLQANARVIRTAAGETARLSPHAVTIVVTNPMDVMTYIAWKVSGLNHRRILGMGGVLDSARFRTFVSLEIGVSPRDIEAIVLGGHGDLMLPLARLATAKGIPLERLVDKNHILRLLKRTREGGAEIVSLLKTGSAYYAPAASVFEMVRAILLDEKRILPCSAYLTGEYGIDDLFMGVPVVLGRKGAERIIEIELTGEEKNEFHRSATATRELLGKVLVE
ncbi:MAG: malate dehydrogenase [Candidatus Sulfobium sp.]|jgi:malate dehydrogenase